MAIWYPTYPRCRFCGEQDIETKFIKYGVRHYAHFACYLDAGKPLAKLHRWQIESFPFRMIKERGLMYEVDRLVKEKQAAEFKADAWRAAQRARDKTEGIE